MSSIPQRQTVVPEAEYLMAERQATEKSEYYQGECFAMAGASRWHNVLAGRMFAALVAHLDGNRCYPYMADMRLHIKTHQHYVYPDVMVVCDEAAYSAEDMVDDATVIIEVLSASTEAYDRGLKFLHYQSLKGLQEYVLISQDSVRVELYRRNAEGNWLYQVFERSSDTLRLESLALAFDVRLAELYRTTPFSQ